MALMGTFFLAMCLAQLLRVHGLQCFDKIENECTPSQLGLICGSLSPVSSDKEQTERECGSDVTMCSLMTVKTKVDGTSFGGISTGYEIESVKAGCLPKGAETGLNSGCQNVNPGDTDLVRANIGTTIKTVEICICDANLCNGSIKSVFNISVIISSLVVSFVLFS